jgi:hypothetical protein
LKSRRGKFLTDISRLCVSGMKWEGVVAVARYSS